MTVLEASTCPVKVTVRDSGDPLTPVIEVGTGVLAVRFLPSAGGRMISLEAHGHEFLWRNPEVFSQNLTVRLPRSRWPVSDGTQASWVNPGGAKTWPAPQGWAGPGQWAGPPDPVLDTGFWDYQIHEGRQTRVTFSSPQDKVTGLEVTRSFLLEAGSTAIEQRTCFRNWTDRPVRWAVWEVVQVDTSCGGHVQVANRPEVPAVLSLDLRGPCTVGAQEGGYWIVPVQDAVGKILLPGALGQLAYRAPAGPWLSLSYDVENDAVACYPDGGARAEIWMQSPQSNPIEEAGGLHPRAQLVELEALSALETLAPGERLCLTLRWQVGVWQ